MEASTINLHSEIIEKCRHGDEIAQYDLYRLYSKAMFNTALRICGNREEAEDVLQESFLNAFRHISSYREESTFGAWLKRIVVNKSITALRKSQKEVLMIDEVPDGYEEKVDVPLEQSSLTVERIKAGVEALPGGFRSVLSLYLFEGYDHKEIAEILGITESTSKSQYKRAKDKLKLILKKEVKYG